MATAFGDDIEEHNKHCKRTEANRGSRRNRICRFPFKFDGVMYDTCTDAKVFYNFPFFHGVATIITKTIFKHISYHVLGMSIICIKRIPMVSFGARQGLIEGHGNTSVEKDIGVTANLVAKQNQNQKKPLRYISLFNRKTP